MPCRINRGRAWTGRILLESYESSTSVFVTLTYNEESVPKDGSVRKRALQLFFKLLRKGLCRKEIRYYAVGEYGTENGRPHYHCIIFNVSILDLPYIEKAWSKLVGYKEGEPVYESLGHVYVGDVTSASAGYVSGYVVKSVLKTCRCKMRYGRGWQKYPCDDGRMHEFSIMSKGIGKGAVDYYVKAYGTTKGQAALARDGWIQECFRTEGKLFGLGRYLKGKVLDEMGVSVKARESHYEDFKKKEWSSKPRSIGHTVVHIRDRAARVKYQEGRIGIIKSKRRTV